MKDFDPDEGLEQKFEMTLKDDKFNKITNITTDVLD